MPFIPAENTVEVQMIFSYQLQVCQNVYHVQLPGEPTQPDLIDIAEAFKDWWDTNLKPLVSSACALTRIICKDISSENDDAIEYSTGLPIAGTGGANSLPNSVTLAIKWVTGLAGRSFRGRTYHIGLDESQVTGNEVLTTPFNALGAAYNALVPAIAALGYTLVVCSKFSDGAARTACVLTEILGAVADNIIDSQRRRLPGRGS